MMIFKNEKRNNTLSLRNRVRHLLKISKDEDEEDPKMFQSYTKKFKCSYKWTKLLSRMISLHMWI